MAGAGDTEKHILHIYGSRLVYLTTIIFSGVKVKKLHVRDLGIEGEIIHGGSSAANRCSVLYNHIIEKMKTQTSAIFA